GTDGDTDVRGHYGPDASNENVLRSHGVDRLFTGPLGIEQEAILLRGNVGVAVAVEPLKSFLADRGVDAPALRNQIGVFQTRRGRHYGGNGPEIPTTGTHDLFQQIRAGYGKAAAQARHAIDL